MAIPGYSRLFSFSDWNVDHPGEPMPGFRLDAEYDAVALTVGGLKVAVDGVLAADGSLKAGVVGAAQLEPGLAAQLTGDIDALLSPYVVQASGSAAQAVVSATQAASAAAEAVGARDSTQGVAIDAQTAQANAWSSAGAALGYRNDALAYRVDTAAYANHALGYRNETTIARDLARQWAEFIGGPVEEAEPLDPDAFDDGFWSAKWWALQAARWVQTGVLPGEGGGGGDGVPGIAGPEGFGVVVYSLAELTALLGPLDGDVALVTDPATIWHFEVGSALTPNESVIAPGDGTAGRWLKLGFAAEAGNALTSNEFYEQPTEPVGAGPGALWIDTSV